MRIGLVGCGSWGRLILRDLITLGAKVAVASPSPQSRATALGLGASSVHVSVADLPLLDGYVVATPTTIHAEVIEALIPTGRPIFTEKPMTNDPAAADRIVARAGERVFAMDKWRYHGGVLQLAELARSGALGTVLQVQSWRLDWENRHDDVDAAWVLLPHDLSIALEILGFLPRLRFATGVATFGRNREISAFLQDDTGPRVGIEISSCHPINRRSVVVIGTEGSAQFGGSYDDVVLLRRHDQPEKRLPIASGMPLLAELRCFVDHLRGGPPPKSTASEAALVVRRIAEIRAMAGLDQP
ncbi:MAG: Gfo/Idh/MocA family oxidoreductase [Rhodobacterales bacterium]|nr:Gfo/Idh/MocA family oxidoreductase [Rhodobacterales bacterium]